MRAVVVALACNNGCFFCAQGRIRETEGLRDTGVLEGEVIEAAREGVLVALVGGEPTLHPALARLARLARSGGAPDVLVQTNGRRLAYPSYAQALREAGVGGVDVSLHGSTAPMHQFHTGAEGSFAQTVTGIGVARGAGMRVGVTVVVTRSNYRHLAEIARLAHARGADALHLALPELRGAALDAAARLMVPAAMLRPHVVEASRLAQRLGLGVRVFGRSSGPSVDERFAGPGVAEAAPAPPPRPAPSARRVELPMIAGVRGAVR